MRQVGYGEIILVVEHSVVTAMLRQAVS